MVFYFDPVFKNGFSPDQAGERGLKISFNPKDSMLMSKPINLEMILQNNF